MRRALSGLDRLTADVADALCLLPAPATGAEVAALLGVAEGAPAVVRALDRLVDLALAAVDGRGRHTLDPLVRQATPRPAGLGPSAESHLRGQHRGFADRVATLLGGVGVKDARSGKKADSVGRALAALGDRERLRVTLLDPPPEARRVFDHLVDGGRVRPTPDLYWSIHGQQTPLGWLYARALVVPSAEGL